MIFNQTNQSHQIVHNLDERYVVNFLGERIKDGIATFDVCMLASKMALLITKLADGPPNHQKQLECFSKSDGHPKSINQLTLKKPAITRDLCLSQYISQLGYITVSKHKRSSSFSPIE